MGSVRRMRLAKIGPASFLFFWIAVGGLILMATHRGDACEISDKLDVVAEGILNDDQLGGNNEATKSMSCKLLVPGPHLKVTPRHHPTPADIERANKIREQARQALGKYQDYQAAIGDGYTVPSAKLAKRRIQFYHFTNSDNAHYNLRYAILDPLRPTSLLYKREKGNYKLLGVM